MKFAPTADRRQIWTRKRMDATQCDFSQLNLKRF